MVVTFGRVVYEFYRLRSTKFKDVGGVPAGGYAVQVSTP